MSSHPGSSRAERIPMSLASVAVLAMLASQPAAGQGTPPNTNWDMSLFGTPRASTRNFDRMAELVHAGTNGRFTITLHYGSTLSAPKEHLDGVQIGAFHAAQVVPGYTPGRLMSIDALELPALPIPNMDVYSTLNIRYLAHPVVEADVARWNGYPIMGITVPPYEFIGRGKPPLDLFEDWKGRRVRAVGGTGAVIKLIGAVPQNLPAPEIYGGMDRGVVDGAALQHYGIHSYRLHEVATWYTTNMASNYSAVLMIANLDSWKKLPDTHRKLVRDSVRPAMDAQRDAYAPADQAAIAAFKERNLTAVTYAAKDLAKWSEMARPIWEEWVQAVTVKGYPGRELLDFVLKTSREASS